MNGMNKVSKVAFMVSLLVASTSSVYAMDWQMQEEAEEVARALKAIQLIEAREAAVRQKAAQLEGENDKDFARAMAKSSRIAQEKKEVEEVEQIAKNLGLLNPQPQIMHNPVAPVGMDDWSARDIEAYFNLQNPGAPVNPQIFNEEDMARAIAESQRFDAERQKREEALQRLSQMYPIDQQVPVYVPAAPVNLQGPNMDDWSAQAIEAYFNLQYPVAPANPQIVNQEEEDMARAIAESQRFDTERQKREEALQRISLQMYSVDQQVPVSVPAVPLNLQGPNMDAWSLEDIETYVKLQEQGINYDPNGEITLAQWKIILSESVNTNQSQRPHINPGPAVPENHLGHQLRAAHIPPSWLGVDGSIGQGMGDVIKANEKLPSRDQQWQVLRDGREKNEHLLAGLLERDEKEKVVEVKKADVAAEIEKAQAQLQEQRVARLQELEEKKKQQVQAAAAHQDGLQDFSVAGIVARFNQEK